jgi:hypothetical protein
MKTEKQMTSRNASIAIVLIATTSFAYAHGPKVGANGGPQADAGSFHVEVVPQGTMLQVFLRDHSDKGVTTAGHKGTAIFVIDGKPQRIPLTPAGDKAAPCRPNFD